MSKESELLRSDYLWDGSGEPDAEILKLERVLGKFGHSGRAPQLPEDFLAAREARAPRQGLRLWFQFAAVAASALVMFSVWAGLRLRSEPSANGVGWGVQQLAGAPRVGAKAIRGAGEKSTLRIGQTLETDEDSRASITVSDVGQVDIDPQTRLRLAESRPARTRLDLERGTIHAMIWAPPGEFMVDTPSALAVDLGCAYTLQVDDSGAGLLRTRMGWVGFRLNGRDAFIPAGAVGETRRGIGPGTPYFEDASPEFRAALREFDFAKLSEEERSAQLTIVLEQARKRDALTLWHMLSRASVADRERVFDRLNEFVPAPSGVTREGIERGEHAMLDAWWNELGYDDISVWRKWEKTEFYQR
jgi:ferric-dicitrate binding protein FerR (iron transport regulator)